MRLLVVDDDAVDREQASRLLEAIDGLEVLEAEDGEAGLEAMAEHEPDVVLSDIRMPKTDGLELVREARTRFPALPVILMTSRGSELIAVEALQAGAANYVPKAELAEHLVETVEAVLSVVTARQERGRILTRLESAAANFKIESDPSLISPLVAYVQDVLTLAEFGDETTRSHIGTALMEALSNAMIHGNLEVSSKLRDAGSKSYHAAIAERRAAAPWANRRVLMTAKREPGQVRFTVRDEGPGFDPTQLPDPTRPEGMLKARGRGLFLIHAFMDEVEHNATGNEIRLLKRV